MSRPPGCPVTAGVSLCAGRTDAVLLDGHRVVPVPAGGSEAGPVLTALLAACPAPAGLHAITLDLSRLLMTAVLSDSPRVRPVAVIRIVPRPANDPALARSPAPHVERLIRARYTVPGGHDLLGNELLPLDARELHAMCDELLATGVDHVAVVGAGSQARPEHERAVADAVEAAVPGVRISTAGDFGGQGLVAREATVVLDCALGAVTDVVLAGWERAIDRQAPAVALRVARGDGGYSTPSRMRALPSVTLGAVNALALCGAAFLAGHADCRVVLAGPDPVAGEVRRGLAVVRPAELVGVGTELVVPTAALAPDRGERDLSAGTDVPVVTAGRELSELACVGAAISRPTAWLDEVAFIESAAQLDTLRRDAAERATAIVMANGAAPGTTYLTELSTVAVPYSPPGTVRIRVRVAGAGDSPRSTP